ncbi:hypothetical protein DZA31_00200 [Arcobacter sp. HD9-500m-PIT-SAG02]|nr:hypothetical protein DZA31_00200 [Arcobacter sp. HD9-500m-PIT-SAG02]
MSSASETINKLSEALNTLITAYEELQGENNKLEVVITQLKEEKANVQEEKKKLEEEKEKVEQEKNSLQDNLATLSDNSEEQNNSMYNMLDKIELLLSNEVSVPNYEKKDEVPNEVIEKEPILESQAKINEEVSPLLKEDNKEPENNSDNKIDLNRMASLLNGFNK